MFGSSPALRLVPFYLSSFFFFNDTAPTEIYTLSLHDALPIFLRMRLEDDDRVVQFGLREVRIEPQDRKSTRLNSSHRTISYAVFCLKKKNASHRLLEEDAGHGAGERNQHVAVGVVPAVGYAED